MAIRAIGPTEEIRKATNGNFVLGSESFKRELAAVLGRRVERGKAGRPLQREPATGQMSLLVSGA